jgi:integrase/recombinase XerD
MDTAIIQTPTSIISPSFSPLDLVDRFISSVDIRPTSRSSYKRSLDLFFRWIDKRGYPINRVSSVELLEYKEKLLLEGLSSLTISSYLTALRSFYNWLSSFTDYPNIATGLKLPKRKQGIQRIPLTPDKARDLLSYSSATKSIRDTAILNLLVRTGLRTIEVVRANVGDIQIRENKRVLVVQRKGSDSKDSIVVLTDKAYKPIEEYLATRGRINNGSPLFTSTSPNSKGERLTTRTISKIAKESLKAVGLTEASYTAHSLRHTAGTIAIDSGESLERVQAMLGHSSPTTTMIYTKYALLRKRIESPPEEAIDRMI